MALSEEDKRFKDNLRHIQTKLGIIGILSFTADIPEGWERLQLEEARPYLEDMKQLMTQWSIVAFQFHKYHGRGYKFSIEEGYGTQCGQGWILKRFPNKQSQV